MAQPISLLAPHQNGAGAGADRHLREAPHKHADALLSALELLQLLHDRGVLDLLRGMVSAGDQLVDTLTAAVDNPESLRAIRNFLLLTKFFGSIHPDVLNSVVQTVVEAAGREKAHRAPGLLQLLRRLRSEDSRHAIAVALDLLESVGKGL
jgi:uncharacterized protein YjgD (DUF1641 family)